MHIECLPPEGQRLLRRFKDIASDNHLVLAGGTALALQLGHRISVDLDFFTRDDFSTESLIQEINKFKLGCQILQEVAGTLTCIVSGVKVSVLRYPYPFMETAGRVKDIPVAGILRIAAIKGKAINQR